MFGSSPDAHERGVEKLQGINGSGGEAVMESLADIAPDLGDYILEFAFGEVYCREGLEPQQRQLITIGALSAQGGCEPQLEVHINGALNVGLSPKQVVEAIIHIAVYAGFPKCLNAMAVAKKVLAERGLLPVT